MSSSITAHVAACVLLTAVTSGAGQIGGGRPGGPPPAPAQAPAPRPAGTGVISGVVRDGHTGRPIAGALVYVGITGRGPASDTSRQLTDARGRFVFVNLPESDSFFLNVSKAGYNDGYYGDTGPVSGGVGSGLIKLGKGDWFRDANIPMFKPAVVAGTVTDEAGEPVVGAYVRVLPRIHVAGVPQLAAGATVRTDDRGRYRIPSLPPGTYLVSVPSVQTAVPRGASPDQIEGISPTAARRDDTRPRNNGALDLDPRSLLIIGNYTTPPPGSRAQAYPPLFAPGVTTVADATAITLAPGEVRDNVAIALRPVPAVKVSGHVEGPAEAWRGMVLRLMPIGLEGLGEGSEVATALVEDRGAFLFLNVPAGQYTLLAQRSMLEYSQRTRFGGSQEMPRTPGLVPGPSTGISGLPSGPPGTQVLSSSVAGDRNYFARLEIGVGESDVANVNVPLRQGLTLRGRIAFDGDGDPPNPVAVVAEPADGNPATGMYQGAARVQPGSDDEFAIAGLPPGRFLIRVLGLTPRHVVRGIRAGATDYTDTGIDTAAGGDGSNFVVTITDRVAVINGTVPMDGQSRLMTVIAFPADRRLWSAYGMSAPRFKTAPVKNDGTFSIPNIPAGDYLLVAVEAAQSRRWQDPAFLEAASRAASRVTAEWGQTRSQVVKPVVIK